MNAGISLSLPLQCWDHKCVPMPSFLCGLKLSLSACKTSTVPAKLSLASVQPFFFHLNPRLPHHLWVPFPQYPGVLKPSSGHVCIKCTPGNEAGLKPAWTGAGCPQPRPLRWSQCTSELLPSGKHLSLHCRTEQHPDPPNAESPQPSWKGKNVPSCDHAKPLQLQTTECHEMTCGRPRDDCEVPRDDCVGV